MPWPVWQDCEIRDTEVVREEMPTADGLSVIVSVVDDHRDLRRGVLARLSQASPSFIAGVKAATVAEFLALEAAAGCRRSDVVLLDLTLKDGTSPEQNVGRGTATASSWN